LAFLIHTELRCTVNHTLNVEADHEASHDAVLTVSIVTSCLLEPNVFPSTTFSNTLSLCSSLIVRGDFCAHIMQLANSNNLLKLEFLAYKRASLTAQGQL